MSTINNLEAFKRFSTARTDVFSNQQDGWKESPLAGTQMFIQGPQYQSIENTNIKYNRNPDADSLKGDKLKTKILPSDSFTKAKVELKKIGKLPGYVYRGFKGDPDANFYEYLSMSNIPYLIGGPMLAGVFAFGITKTGTQQRAAAVSRTKQIAAGVALYYLGVELAKKAVDIPVKLFRGVDLNHPYENVVSGKADSRTGHSPKKIEYHKVPESVDFTRWDLLYNITTDKHGRNVNKEFDRLAGKFGVDKKLSDSDSLLKEKMKALIVSATACKYMLAAPFVVLGVALSGQQKDGNPIWDDLGKGFKTQIKTVFGKKSKVSMSRRWQAVKEIVSGNVVSPMKESFKSLWGRDGASNKLGKAIIITAAVAPILANLRVMQLSSARGNKFVDAGKNK